MQSPAFSRYLYAVFFFVFAIVRVQAQAPVLGLSVSGGYARLTVSGANGNSYAIQFKDDLATNSWLPLTTVNLSNSPSVVFDNTQLATTRRFYRVAPQTAATNVIVSNMVWAPPGTFLMGSPVTEEDRQANETQHSVTLTHGFYIGKDLVTQADFLSVMGYNPSYFNGPRLTNDYGTDLSRPVENVTWYAAQSYCSQLTLNEQNAGRLPLNWAYRLPTEAEWEYACRAGTTTRFSYGDDPTYSSLTSYAWYSGNSSNMTHDVALKLANPWGMHDVHGDVYEWCQDWLGSYPTNAVIDPQGPQTGSLNVFRGGSWAYGGAACRSAGRYGESPTSTDTFLGFRVVAAPVQ
jgi:formylglycine-generating enzyme required for sulfatase activity